MQLRALCGLANQSFSHLRDMPDCVFRWTWPLIPVERDRCASGGVTRL